MSFPRGWHVPTMGLARTSAVLCSRITLASVSGRTIPSLRGTRIPIGNRKVLIVAARMNNCAGVLTDRNWLGHSWTTCIRCRKTTNDIQDDREWLRLKSWHLKAVTARYTTLHHIYIFIANTRCSYTMRRYKNSYFADRVASRRVVLRVMRHLFQLSLSRTCILTRR